MQPNYAGHPQVDQMLQILEFSKDTHLVNQANEFLFDFCSSNALETPMIQYYLEKESKIQSIYGAKLLE